MTTWGQAFHAAGGIYVRNMPDGHDGDHWTERASDE